MISASSISSCPSRPTHSKLTGCSCPRRPSGRSHDARARTPHARRGRDCAGELGDVVEVNHERWPLRGRLPQAQYANDGLALTPQTPLKRAQKAIAKIEAHLTDMGRRIPA